MDPVTDQANLLGKAWSELASGNASEAARLGRNALAALPDDVQALHLLGLSCWALGDLSAAVDMLARGAALDGSHARLHCDLGVLRCLQENWRAAFEAFSQCLLLQPGDHTALHGQAKCLVRLGRYTDAEKASRKWLLAAPDSPGPLRMLAQCLALQLRLDEAQTAAERSLALDPQSDTALMLLAAVCQKQGRFELSRAYMLRAAALRPDSANVMGRLAIACWDAGDLDSALQARERALALHVSDRSVRTNLDWLALHDPAQTAEGLLEVHRLSALSWTGDPAPVQPHTNPRNPGKRLRVGYLSGEFVSAATYCFVSHWLARHDPAEVETFYYLSRALVDDYTGRYRQYADHWRDVWALSDDELARLVREDQVDILVDLSGHFENNRLGVFGRRPAPVQVTYPNYPSTTGLSSIDYLLTDVWTSPPGCEAEYAERLWRLPSGYIAFQTYDGHLPSPLPSLSRGEITFGLFQRPGKLHAAVWDIVAGVLSQLPGSRLLIHFSSGELDEEGNAQRSRLLAPLEARGISPGRVLFRGARQLPEHLSVVAEADIALDTFPYNGQTTTCDCFWMGVPVVSLRGRSHASRVTPGLLQRLDLGDLVAETPAGYVRVAVDLANNKDRLAHLRANLRASMSACSLTGGTRLAREIEAAYRQMWLSWCAG